MLTSAQLLHYLDRLLLGRVKVSEAQRATFPAGTVHAPGTVVAPKILLMLSGRVEYALNDQTFDLSPGVMFHRPAKSVGRWRVRRACKFLWCEFSSSALLMEALITTARDVDLERAALERIRLLHWQHGLRAGLEIEGEVKAVLARFVTTAAGQAGDAVAPFLHAISAARSTRASAAVRQAVTWLAEHLTEPDAMHDLHDRVGLSRDHFRREFVGQMGLSARAYLTHLRMHSARFYLRRADLAVKEVASLVGYADPLYFSRHYRAFHGHPPAEERGAVRSTRQK